MSKKDFELIAETIKSLNGINGIHTLYIAKQFARVLARTNPAFNVARFIAACVEVA